MAASRTQRAGVGALFLCLSWAAGSTLAQDLIFDPAPVSGQTTAGVLLDVAAAGERLIAVGAAGVITVSDDDGTTWRQVSVPVSATLTAVHFPTATHGWAVGHAGVILHSSDAGETWEKQFDGRQANEALLAYAAAQRTALEAELEEREAAGDGAALASDLEDLDYALEDAIFLEEDARVAIETGPADPLLAVRFLDAQRGFAAGAYGAFLRTEDGGTTWELSLSGLDNPDRFHFYALHAASDGDLYLVGEAGLMFRSTDSGLTFDRYWDVYDGSLFGLIESGEGVLAFGLRGNLFAYEGEADEWRALATANEISLYGGTVRADGSAIIVGAGGRIVYRAADGTEELGEHPARTTLSGAVVATSSKVFLVGMDGLLSESEEAQP